MGDYLEEYNGLKIGDYVIVKDTEHLRKHWSSAEKFIGKKLKITDIIANVHFRYTNKIEVCFILDNNRYSTNYRYEDLKRINNNIPQLVEINGRFIWEI